MPKPICETDDDCSDAEACVESACVDPCINKCQLAVQCRVKAHRPICCNSSDESCSPIGATTLNYTDLDNTFETIHTTLQTLTDASTSPFAPIFTTEILTVTCKEESTVASTDITENITIETTNESDTTTVSTEIATESLENTTVSASTARTTTFKIENSTYNSEEIITENISYSTTIETTKTEFEFDYGENGSTEIIVPQNVTSTSLVTFVYTDNTDITTSNKNTETTTIKTEVSSIVEVPDNISIVPITEIPNANDEEISTVTSTSPFTTAQYSTITELIVNPLKETTETYIERDTSKEFTQEWNTAETDLIDTTEPYIKDTTPFFISTTNIIDVNDSHKNTDISTTDQSSTEYVSYFTTKKSLTDYITTTEKFMEQNSSTEQLSTSQEFTEQYTTSKDISIEESTERISSTGYETSEHFITSTQAIQYNTTVYFTEEYSTTEQFLITEFYTTPEIIRNKTDMFCMVHTDCTECETCIDGLCQNPCNTSNPCPKNILCDVVNHRPVCLHSNTEQSTSNCSVLPGKHFYCREFR
ncbi:mucin-22-like [Cardiocondyla obscurior]|uniref:mucin-22-like n=1 Tax=Cardiocondyla obscurior TaxID=286306 RepID=UPI0039655E84